GIRDRNVTGVQTCALPIWTINLADLADKVSDSGQTPLLTTISILYLIVFALKSGLLLFFWLPGSYSVPPTAVAALFGALLTKVRSEERRVGQVHEYSQ